MSIIKTEKLFCDVCKKEIVDSSGNLHFSHNVKDYLGNDCARREIIFNDICYDCCKKLDDVIVDTAAKIEEENKYVND